MSETKLFPLRDVLTVTTRRLLTKSKGERDNGIGDLYALLNWMTSDNLFTHQLPRAGEECKPWLLRWFPELKHAKTSDLDVFVKQHGTEKGIDHWITSLVITCCKEFYDVPKIPADDHERKDAYDELVEMRGTDENIIIVKDGENES